jgi:hypothetical protein
MRVANDSLLNEGETIALASSWESKAINLASIMNYSIQLKWTGTPVGQYKLQCSNDPNDSNRGDNYWASKVATWTDIEGSEQLVNMDGNHTWQVRSAGYMWVRVVWLPTSGSGTLTSARFTAKGL